MTRLKIILNPHSGRGKGGRLAASIRGSLDRAGVDYDMVQTEGVGHAIALAREIKPGAYDGIVAVGGDGTVSEVVNGLVHTTPPDLPIGPLGILPVGTGNDLATMAGIPKKMDQAIHTLLTGRIRSIDLGRAVIQTATGSQVHYFANNLGCGLEAQVSVAIRRIPYLRGSLVYVAGVLLALMDYRQPRVVLGWQDNDGGLTSQIKQVLMVSVGNSRRTGGMYYVTPDAQLDDGRLDMGIIDALPRRRILWLMPKVFFGAHTHEPEFTLVQTRQISISSSDYLPVQADGEVICADADGLTIDIQPARLSLLCP